MFRMSRQALVRDSPVFLQAAGGEQENPREGEELSLEGLLELRAGDAEAQPGGLLFRLHGLRRPGHPLGGRQRGPVVQGPLAQRLAVGHGVGLGEGSPGAGGERLHLLGPGSDAKHRLPVLFEGLVVSLDALLVGREGAPPVAPASAAPGEGEEREPAKEDPEHGVEGHDPMERCSEKGKPAHSCCLL